MRGRSGGRRYGRLGGALVVAVVAVAGLATVGASAGQGIAPVALERAMDRLRTVTGAFHAEPLAEAGGFASTDICVASPDGGMGYHYVHGARISDDVVNRDKPEVLLYGPAQGNERALLGVEYFKADADQDLGTDDDRPTLFGRPFDGPMPGHEPGMPIHYDLHVWLWRTNPNGLFAPFNPRVDCPDES